MVQWTDSEVDYLKLNYSTSTREELQDKLNRKWSAIRKKAERTGLNRHPQYELIKSIREAPTPHFPDEQFNHYIVGLVDGEGTFTVKNNNNRPRQHRFGIELVETDRGILEEIKDYLNVGNIHEYNSPNSNEQPTVTYNVQSFGELICVIIPFFQEYSPRAKQKKFDFDYWSASILSKPDFRIERFK